MVGFGSIPGALNGVEASLQMRAVHKLRTAVCRVVWSGRQPLASAGALLSLLDGQTGCDPAFLVLFGSGFGCCEGMWPIGLRKLFGFTGWVGSAAEGCPGHGPAHLLC